MGSFLAADISKMGLSETTIAKLSLFDNHMMLMHLGTFSEIFIYAFHAFARLKVLHLHTFKSIYLRTCFCTHILSSYYKFDILYIQLA